MPLIKIHHPKGAIEPHQKTQLAQAFTTLLLKIEGAQDSPGARTLAYVIFQEISHSDWYVGGEQDNSFQVGLERLIVEVMVPEASTTQAFKGDIHRGIQEALAKALNWKLHDLSGINAWVIIKEVPEGHWGANGETFGLGKIMEFAQAAPDIERGTFVKAYFKAKAALYATAGFPIGASGLFVKTAVKPSTSILKKDSK